MSASIHLPHLLVIPEDDANRQIILGFKNHLSVKSRQIQIEPVANGWRKALEKFNNAHAALLKKYGNRHVLILIDLDGYENRLAEAAQLIPEDLRDRVFIMGSLHTPEKLAKALKKSKEKIGEALADECVGGGNQFLASHHLAHNEAELRRMQRSICPHLMS